MKKTQDDYIKYRLERAWKTFEDAKSLATLKSWNSSMNRLYYACFYAVHALFTKHKINSHTHSGSIIYHVDTILFKAIFSPSQTLSTPL